MSKSKVPILYNNKSSILTSKWTKIHISLFSNFYQWPINWLNVILWLDSLGERNRLSNNHEININKPETANQYEIYNCCQFLMTFTHVHIFHIFIFTWKDCNKVGVKNIYGLWLWNIKINIFDKNLW